MNCPDQANCFEILELALDGEINEKDREQFEMQIKNCMPCYQRHHLDKSIKELIQKKLEQKSAPESLVNAIKSNLKNGQ